MVSTKEKLKQVIQNHEDELLKGDIKGFIKQLYIESGNDWQYEDIYYDGLKLLENQVDNIFTLVAKNYKGKIPEDFFVDYHFNDTKITIPGSIHRICNGAFFSCDLLEDVVLSDGVEEIEKAAFAECDGLNSITIPESVTKIDKELFGKYHEPITIICKEGSYADNFAKENGFKTRYIN